MNPPMNTFAMALFERLAWSIPYFAVIGIGLWICAKQKAVHPRLSSTFSLAFTFFAAHSILGPVSRAWMAAHTDLTSSVSNVKIALIYGIASGLAAILNYAGWTVLLLAIHRAFLELAQLGDGEMVDQSTDS